MAVLRALDPDRRLAAGACGVLLFSIFLPWYGGDVTLRGKPISKTLTAIGAFSLVELGVILLALAVVALLWARAENRDFHLPGTDGFWIAAAGFWAIFLIVYRMLDRPEDLVVGKLGPRWGIFIALAAAIALAVAGVRERRHELGAGEAPPGDEPLLGPEESLPPDERDPPRRI